MVIAKMLVGLSELMSHQALVAILFVRTNLLLKLGYLVSVLYVYS